MVNSSYRFARPLLHLLDPEIAHGASIWFLRHGWGGADTTPDDPVLATRVWNLAFANPVGLAAGFDKNGEVIDAMLKLGFGFVEAGTVTPLPQPGNPKPRLFRLVEDEGVINRFGFNSRGLAAFAGNLRARAASDKRARGVVGANVGKNRDATDAGADYATGIAAVCGLADYLVCNVSSPNTPGLRDLQARGQIEELIGRVLEARQRASAGVARPPPLLVKVGPDLDEGQMRDIAEVALASGIDGLIVGNTTVARPDSLRSRHAREAGGLSGRPLLAPAAACLSRHVPSDRRQNTDHRLRRDRERCGCVCADSRRRVAGAVLFGAGVSRTGAGRPRQTRTGRLPARRRIHRRRGRGRRRLPLTVAR